LINYGGYEGIKKKKNRNKAKIMIVLLQGWNDSFLKIFTISISPIVIEPMSNFGVDCAHRFHVRFSPLPAQIFRLHFEQFQNIQLKCGVFHF